VLNQEIENILAAARDQGWVLEPEAKRLFSLAGMDTPQFIWAKELGEALDFAGQIGYPVVAKVVSPQALHKSDVGGVAAGLENEAQLSQTFSRFKGIEGFAGMLVEEMVSGVELIVGAKVDYQFGPVILFGIGGTGVEIYQDTTLRMAPLQKEDVVSMIKSLKAHQLLEGYRGSGGVNLEELSRTLITFSSLVMELKQLIESVDLNPVICSPQKCLVADARIILNKGRSPD